MNVKTTRHNGILKVDIDGRLFLPLSFKSFRPNPRNVSEFYSAGVRLFSVLSSGVTSALGVPYSLYGESWVGEREYDFAPVDRQMDMFIENAPEAYFAPMIQLDTRDWYLKEHPEAPNSFTHLSQIAHDETWRTLAKDYMVAMMRHLEEKYGDRIYGYFLLCGTTTEWFSEKDYERSHPIKEKAYGKPLPSFERLNLSGDTFLSPDEEDVFEARRFHSKTLSSLILYFAGEAQKVLKHEKLLGIYYGYLFELGGERIYNDGIFDYESVYFSDDIDMISSPSAYGYRGIDDPSAFMVTSKTLDAHGKLYFLEFDHITHTAPEEISDGLDKTAKNCGIIKIPGADSKCKSECESLNLMYRDFLLCRANLTAMWWFDMFDGWFRSEGMMGAVSKMIRLSNDEGNTGVTRSREIAVFAEGESMYRVRKSAGIADVTLSDARRTLAECGTEYDLYSISDIHREEIGDYKFLLFLNQYDVKPKTRARIDELLEKTDAVALWLYGAGYATDGKNSVDEIESLTGIGISESRVSHGELIYREKEYDYPTMPPYFSIKDDNATPLAYFKDGAPAVARRGKNIYSATPNLPSALLCEIARTVGAWIYTEDSRVYVYPRSDSLGVYNASGEECVVFVKEDGEYLDLLSSRTFSTLDGRLTLPKSDINAFLLKKS